MRSRVWLRQECKMAKTRLFDPNPNGFIEHDHNHDGINRRGVLKCMAWAGTGALCLVEGGVLKSFALGDANGIGGEIPQAWELTFVQISDSHMGFNKPGNPDVIGTLKAAVDKINALPHQPDTAFSTAFIQPAPGKADGPGPM